MPAAATRRTSSWVSSGLRGPSGSHALTPPGRPGSTNTVARQPCLRSTGSASPRKSAYPSSKVSPTSPRRPDAPARSSSDTPTPVSRRLRSQDSCSSRRSGETVMPYGSSLGSVTEWYVRIHG